MNGRNFIEKIFLNTMQLNIAWKFLTVTEKC